MDTFGLDRQTFTKKRKRNTVVSIICIFPIFFPFILVKLKVKKKKKLSRVETFPFAREIIAGESGETSNRFEHAFDLRAVFVTFRNHTFENIEYSGKPVLII